MSSRLKFGCFGTLSTIFARTVDLTFLNRNSARFQTARQVTRNAPGENWRRRRRTIASHSPLPDSSPRRPTNPLHFVATGVMDHHAPTKRKKDSPQ
jgi:hypothetical protein